MSIHFGPSKDVDEDEFEPINLLVSIFSKAKQSLNSKHDVTALSQAEAKALLFVRCITIDNPFILLLRAITPNSTHYAPSGIISFQKLLDEVDINCAAPTGYSPKWIAL